MVEKQEIEANSQLIGPFDKLTVTPQNGDASSKDVTKQEGEGSLVLGDDEDESPAFAKADAKLLDAAGKFNEKVVGSGGLDENGEPIERDELPWLKDPNTRYSIWSMIKDNMSKDLSRVSLPVYLNDPTSILQKSAQATEY